MVYLPSPEGGHDPNFPNHVRGYLGFLKMLKWSLLLTAVVTAVVLYTIAN